MGLRQRLLNRLFIVSHGPYAQLFKRDREGWGLSVEELLAYPPETLGHRLGRYLERNGFTLLPKLENHDVYHVLTETGTDVRSEIGLQFLLRGNGKSSPYLLGAVLLGGLVMAEHLPYFLRQHGRGAAMPRFHDTDFHPLLGTSVGLVRAGDPRVVSDRAAVVWQFIERFSLASRF